MRSPFALAVFASTVALLAAGCGSSTSSTSTGSATKSTSAASNSPYGETQSTSAAASTTGSTSTPAGRSGIVASDHRSVGVLIVSKHSHDGTILAAGTKRLTVYMFEGDHGTASSCRGVCAQVWPPVTTTGAPTVSGAAVTADLGTITRSDGTKQVTYKGHPLYFYAKDKDDGDAYGQGVHGFGADWYVLQPSGAKLDNS